MSERNFCERCGKRIAGNELDIHTCTPPAPKRPQNCGTGHCSCIECVMEPAQQEPTVDDDSQDWRGMDGAIAWHLIDRHADGWSDVGKMMGEWLEANQPQPAQPSKPLTDEQIKIIWRDIDGSEGMLMRFARAIEAAHGITGEQK